MKCRNDWSDAWDEKKRVHASTLKMRLMHGVEKQELMQHFLGSAGRSAHPTLETWCPATKEQGFAESGAPRPPGGRPPTPDPPSGDSPTWCRGSLKLRRARSRPWDRRPKSPNQWRGHGVESLGGRRPQQAGTHTRPRPAEASSKSAPAPPGGQPTYAPRPGSSAIAKPVNQKTGAAREQLLFLSSSRIPSLREPFILPGYR